MKVDGEFSMIYSLLNILCHGSDGYDYKDVVSSYSDVLIFWMTLK